MGWLAGYIRDGETGDRLAAQVHLRLANGRYALLNCGINLPASTGSDWFLCSNNRVYVQTCGEFTYDGWLANLRSRKSFITNGPALL